MNKVPFRLYGGVDHELRVLAQYSKQSVLPENYIALLGDSNIILQGGIDDIWLDKNDDKLIVVDYKSQANSKPVNTADYLSHVYHQGYKVQMDFYSYLLTEMGFEVSPVSYFYVCNADRSAPAFDSKMIFEETLVPYKWDSSWIEEKVLEMIDLLNSEKLPENNPSCENCAYALQRRNIEV